MASRRCIIKPESRYAHAHVTAEISLYSLERTIGDVDIVLVYYRKAQYKPRIEKDAFPRGRGPKDHVNIRISDSGSKAQYQGDTRTHVLQEPYDNVHVVFGGSIQRLPSYDYWNFHAWGWHLMVSIGLYNILLGIWFHRLKAKPAC